MAGDKKHLERVRRLVESAEVGLQDFRDKQPTIPVVHAVINAQVAVMDGVRNTLRALERELPAAPPKPRRRAKKKDKP